MRRLTLVVTVIVFSGIKALAQPRPEVNPYPLSPIGPTDSRQCDAYQQQISQIKASYEKQHQDCLSANSRAPTIPNSGDLICSKSACQSLHDIVYGDFSKRAEAAAQACREQVQMYQHALESVTDAGMQQRQVIQAQGNAQVANIDAGRDARAQQGDQISRQADLNRQRSADADKLADIYRQQAEAASRERPNMNGAQLASLDAAQRRLDAINTPSEMTSSGAVAVDQRSSDFRSLLDTAKERIVDGLVSALRSTGDRGNLVADSVENIQSLRQTWTSFTTLAKNDASTDQQLDSIRDLADQANDRFNTNPVSRFLFPKLLSGGVIEPYKTAMNDLDRAMAAFKGSDVPMNEVNEFISSDDPGRYFPFVAELRKWTQTSIVYRTVDKFRESLGVGVGK